MPVRLLVIASLLALGLVPPASAGGGHHDQPYLSSYEGELEFVSLEAPSALPEDDDEDEHKPPDWCEVTGGLLGEVPPEVPDLPGQGDEGPASTSAPQSASTTSGVEGIADTGFCPPDPTVAAGPNNVLVAVNASIASYSKAATPAKQWERTLRRWLEPLWEVVSIDDEVPLPELFYFHPDLVYDHQAERFVVAVAAVDAHPVPDHDPFRHGASSVLIFGVSETSNPNGEWCFTAIPTPGTFAHYPRVGYNSGYWFLTNNEYLPGDTGRVWASLYAIAKPRTRLDESLPCGARRMTATIGLLDPDQPAMFVQPPLAGPEPYHLVSSTYPAGLRADAPSGFHDELTLWTVADGMPPVEEPDRVTVATYHRPRGEGAPQAGCGSKGLDLLDTRLRNAVYHEGEIWASQVSQLANAGGRSEIRVYRVDLAADPPAAKSFPFTPSDPDAWYLNPSVAITSAGEGLLTFNRSGPTENPSIWTSSVPPSTFGSPAPWGNLTRLKLSTRCYEQPPGDWVINSVPGLGNLGTRSSHRWGESAGTSPDPNGSGVWVYNVYAGAEEHTWATHLERVDP